MTQHLKRYLAMTLIGCVMVSLCMIVNTAGTDSTHALQAPNLKHVLGTDQLGRDFLQDCLLVVV